MSKNNSIFWLLAAASLATSAWAQSVTRPEILTLFTTRQERDLIDNNRYRTNTQKVEMPTKEAAPQPQKKVLMEEVALNIKLNGVSLNQSGQNVAWLNGKAYENGAKLDDGSSIYISGTLNAKVKLKTPDGKYHSLVTGETTEIKYSKVVEG